MSDRIEEAAELIKAEAREQHEEHGEGNYDPDAQRSWKQAMIRELKNEVFDAWGY